MTSDLQARDSGEPGARPRAAPAGRALAFLVLGLSLGLALCGLYRGMAHRVPLAVVLGARYWAWLALAVASTVGAAASLVACMLDRAHAELWSTPRIVRLVFCHVVLGALVYVLFFQPFQRLYLEMVASVWAGSLVTWIVLEPRVLGRLRPRTARALKLSTVSVCAAALGLEVGLAVLAKLRPIPVLAQARRGPVEMLAESRFTPGRMHLGTPVNSRGYYDTEFAPKAPGKTLVVSIADSFGASTVPLEHHFTSVAERRLQNVAIYNMGVGGIGPPEYLHLLVFEALPLHPDLVVINIFVGNDIAFDRGPGGETDAGLRSWLDADHVYLVTVPRRLMRIARERALYSRETSPGSRDVPQTPLNETPASEAKGDMPWLVDPRLEPPTFSKTLFLENQRIHARDVAGGGEEVFGPFFDAMASIVRAAGDTPLLVVLIPEEFQVEDELWEDVRAGLPGIELDRDRAQHRIQAWLAERGVACIDLLPRLRAVEPLDDGKRHVYLLRDTHFNVRGNEVAGEALAQWIAEHVH